MKDDEDNKRYEESFFRRDTPNVVTGSRESYAVGKADETFKVNSPIPNANKQPANCQVSVEYILDPSIRNRKQDAVGVKV